MKTSLSLAIGTLLLVHSLAGAAGSPEPAAKNEQSLDVVTQSRVQTRAAVAAVMDDASIATVTPEQVGDADSFGRQVKYLGLVMSRAVILQPDCTGFDSSFGDRCRPLQPDSNSFNEADLGRIDLPAKASHSLLCFSLTDVSTVQFENPTSVPRVAQLRNAATILIESPVLNDPGLIDPSTGLPFNGQLPLALGFPLEMHTIAPGAIDFRSGIGPTRSCIGGLVSKQSLIQRGLTEKQATQFFKKPITLRFGSHGFSSSLSFLDFEYGIRIYGD